MKNTIVNVNEKATENFTIATLENGTKSIKANWTVDNISKAIELINTASDKADYSKAVIAYAVTYNHRASDSKEDKKILKTLKTSLAAEMRIKDTAALDKYIAVAENFLEIDSDLLVGRWDRDENGHTIPSLDINFNAVHGLKDKYGFEFSLGALQEMLWLKDENGNVDIPKLTELIADGKLKASMPNCSTKNGIRGVINENKLKAIETTAEDKNTQNTSTDGNSTDDKETIVFTKSSEKERMIAIQNIVNGFSTETIDKYPMFKEFVEFIPNFIANCK